MAEMKPNITVEGTIMSEPELRQTASGKDIASCNFSAYAGKGKDGKYNPGLWFKLIAWEEQAGDLMALKNRERTSITGFIGYEAPYKEGAKGQYTINVKTVGDNDFVRED